MQNSKIEWTDHTLNFWWGCTKVSEACRNCYAETQAKIFASRVFGRAVTWGPGQERAERLTAARKEALTHQRRAAKQHAAAKTEGGKTQTRVFVNSMSDWLDDAVPVHWLAFLLETIALCPALTFQLLTKRPQLFRRRMEEVIFESAAHAAEDWPHGGADVASFWLANSPPKNVWIGTTVEDQHAADTRIPQLLEIPACVRYLSCEPLLGPVNLGDYRHTSQGEWKMDGFHWVIAGGESGGQARASHPDWFYSLRDQCTAANVPFFFKQWGEWIPSGKEATHLPESKGYKPDRFRDGLIVLRAGTAAAGRQLEGREWNEYAQ
jgi:protein gp37